MILVLKKVKSPYVTSVAQNGHVTHKPEADGALILPPPPPLPLPSPLTLSPFYGYLKLLQSTRKGKAAWSSGWSAGLAIRRPRVQVPP